ncbi:383_t:CDS:2 [Entrophospora sp. SA101]|nr:383_t:CDS:2 [Entrophospora sp. SA101]
MNKNNNKTVKVRTTKINEVRQQQESAYEKQLMLNRNNCLKIKNIIQGFEEIENIVMNLSTNTIIG